MKIDIYLNDYFTAYYRPCPDKSRLTNISFDVLTKLNTLDATFIFRGEPTLNSYLHDILDLYKDKSYILSTDGTNPDPLINYKGKIPYLSIRYDGYMNDTLRRNNKLSYNVMKLLEAFKNKETILRIEYVISNHNLNWLKLDLDIIRNYLSIYPNMKQPYFVLYQKSDVFTEPNFIWTPLSKEVIDLINTKNLFTQSSLNSLMAWYNKTPYRCTAPQNNIIVWYDGTMRLCQSHRCKEIIGNLLTDDLSIIEKTLDIRSATGDCPFRDQCWIAYHHKDNINVFQGEQ
jgi:MoaA/NifB/PqqE/SkfB family radical SAM enzyme